MYQPVLDALGGSLLLTALVAMLPLVVLFVLIGVVRLTAWKAGLIALVLSLLVAVLAYAMPVGQALLSATEGAAFGFFPILWVVINAIWVYNMTVVTGHFDVLRRSFAKVSDDQRIQAVIIAFCFGALLEALAGFGTPVAITSVMLLAIGIKPLKAAVVALVANTAPVAFGALAVPITTLAKVSGQDEHLLSSMVGRQTPLLAVIVPMILVFIIDRRRGLVQTLPATLTCGIVFSLAQFVTSNFISTQLTDIVAALVAALAVVLLLRVWQPRGAFVPAADADEASGRSQASGAGVRTPEEMAEADRDAHDTTADVVRAYAPYGIIVALFVVTQLPGIKDLIAHEALNPSFQWPGLHLLNAAGEPSTIPTFKLDIPASAGTWLVIAGLISIPVIGISPARAWRAYTGTYKQLAAAIVTVMAVLSLAYVMNASGQTSTLGTWLAASGGLFALVSPVLGWIGVAVTGSDTSSNSLFGALQASAAQQAGLEPLLTASANSSGGVLGKMISPQNLAIAAAAVGLAGKEGEILRRVLPWSIVFLALMCVIVFLQSTPVLAWMIP
ncbi:L-lactate permease [Brachybacterium sp. NPDC056505]|uniref:L-lactate permease n=1 Tax=Brachybacterium sp. NPDC056505 TaxID=3345843 RepID=UPI0036701322